MLGLFNTTVYIRLTERDGEFVYTTRCGRLALSGRRVMTERTGSSIDDRTTDIEDRIPPVKSQNGQPKETAE